MSARGCASTVSPMPRLANESYEQFARAYVQSGANGSAALRAVGYADAPSNRARLLQMPQIAARIAELSENMLSAADISAQRVMLELGRIAFSDIRRCFNAAGELIPIHDMDVDAAAAITGIEHETHVKLGRKVLNLATGEMEPEIIHVRTAKIKRANKDAALQTLAKHFKLIGDEGDGVNALANALADRLKTARRRVDLVERVDDTPDHQQPPEIAP